jgi:hypothetical protein
MDEINPPGSSTQPTQEGAPPFVVEAAPEYATFEKVEVTEVDETKPWKPATKVAVTLEGGQRVEIDANTPFFTFRGREGKNLTVSAAAAGHIDELHIRGTDAGSLFDEPSLEALMQDAAPKIPAEVATAPGVSAFDIEMGKGMGHEGIAAMDELVESGVLTPEDVATAAALKDEVVALNREGTKEAKEAFIVAHGQGKVGFRLIRGDVLVPVVEAPKRPTTKLFMVFGPGASGDTKTLYTAAPGRNMPRHPNPNQHKNADGVLDEVTFKESSDAWFTTVMLTGVERAAS